jgi:uncharacterized membrane-anchored protein
MARLAAEGHKVILGCRRVLGFGYADSGLAEKQDGSEAVFSRMASEPIAVRLARLLVEERGPTSSLCMTPSVVMGTQTTARSIASGYAPPWLITHRVDVSAYLEQKHAAMEAHVSQMASDEGTRSLAGFVPLPSSLFRLAFGREWFVEHGRVPTDHPSIMSSPVWAVIPEDDPASARLIPMVGAAGQAATANRGADIDKSTSESRLNRMSTRRALSGRAHSGELPVIGRMIPVPAAAKVPEIIFVFWVVKILTTAGGEATSDYLKTFGNIGGGGTELILLVLGLVLQFGTRRYRAFAYWSLAYAIAIFGTGVSDFLHLDVKIPYAGTTLLWAVVLAGIFWTWNRHEGTLSIHSVTTERREAFYWATVFATFALGTALGDFTATSLGLGYLASGLLFAVIILIPAVARWRLGLNTIAAFWMAYVVTRPLGASFADYLSKSRATSGIGFGDGPTALVFAIAVFALVTYLAITRPDIQKPSATTPPRS